MPCLHLPSQDTPSTPHPAYSIIIHAAAARYQQAPCYSHRLVAAAAAAAADSPPRPRCKAGRVQWQKVHQGQVEHLDSCSRGRGGGQDEWVLGVNTWIHAAVAGVWGGQDEWVLGVNTWMHAAEAGGGGRLVLEQKNKS